MNCTSCDDFGFWLVFVWLGTRNVLSNSYLFLHCSRRMMLTNPASLSHCSSRRCLAICFLVTAVLEMQLLRNIDMLSHCAGCAVDILIVGQRLCDSYLLWFLNKAGLRSYIVVRRLVQFGRVTGNLVIG